MGTQNWHTGVLASHRDFLPVRLTVQGVMCSQKMFRETVVRTPSVDIQELRICHVVMVLRERTVLHVG